MLGHDRVNEHSGNRGIGRPLVRFHQDLNLPACFPCTVNTFLCFFGRKLAYIKYFSKSIGYSNSK